MRKPAFQCKNGTLEIATSMTRFRLRWKPEPLAEEKLRRKNTEWDECWPAFPVVIPRGKAANAMRESAPNALRAFRSFNRTIPKALREIVAPFESHQWPLLRGMGRFKEIQELAESNPVLAYAFANNSELRGTKDATAAFQLQSHRRDRQKNLCEWLRFPGTRAMANVFKKIVPEAVTPSVLRRFRIALRRDVRILKLLAHCRAINGAVLGFVLSEKLLPLTTTSLLGELAQLDAEKVYGSTADRVEHALMLHRQVRSRDEIRPLTSLKRAEEFILDADLSYLEHQQMLANVEERRRRAAANAKQARRRAACERRNEQHKLIRKMKKEWPAPPIKGTDDIVPIASYKMLCEEAALQKNCVRTYGRSVLRGSCYIYRLLKPRRCTICIVPWGGGQWRISQIAECGNNATATAARTAVETWLESHRWTMVERDLRARS